MTFRNPEKIARITTIVLVCYLLGFGVAEAFFPIRPFWNDEWRLIYNVKFKNLHQLWGVLDLLQECPRTYLSLLKLITGYFDYSYVSLRLPALLLTTANVLLVLHLRKKMFPAGGAASYLFPLILISSQTFTDYMVQFKHYEVDILLCLVSLWQLLALLDLSGGNKLPLGKLVLLCGSFAVAPFFSYIYAVTVLPVFLVGCLAFYKSGDKRQLHWLVGGFLLFAIATIVFYLVDARNLMANARMYSSYRKMLGLTDGEHPFIVNIWRLFALVGSGALFEVVFGLLGFTAVAWGCAALKKGSTLLFRQWYLHLYALLLLMVTTAMILSGKMMGGVARLTVFTVPSIAYLIVIMLQDAAANRRIVKAANTMVVILFAGLAGNILTTCINTFTYPEYINRITTYKRVGEALDLARRSHLPMLYTDGVKGDKISESSYEPGLIREHTITAEQIAGVDTLCAEVILKVHPAYKVWDACPLFLAPDFKYLPVYVQQVPGAYPAVIATDGLQTMKLEHLGCPR